MNGYEPVTLEMLNSEVLYSENKVITPTLIVPYPYSYPTPKPNFNPGLNPFSVGLGNFFKIQTEKWYNYMSV